MLQEGEGEHCHERMAMETLPGSPFEVIEAKFLFQLLMGLLANPSCLDGGRQGTQTGRAIVNAGWSCGTRIPRQGRWYDPFCPKILGILGKTKLPRTIASRSIILRMWPKKPDEKTEDFAYAGDPEFSTIWRKLARWASDNVRIIKNLKPPQPPGFNNRLSANWKLLLQIAQHAGGGWPEQARRSAIYLSRAPYEPSVGVQLLAALRAMFAKNRTQITSEQVVQELLADPDFAVARISQPRSNHQKPGRGIAERLRDPACRRSSNQASRSLAARLQGSAIRGRVCAFLITRAEHPNTQAWGGELSERDCSAAQSTSAKDLGLPNASR